MTPTTRRDLPSTPNPGTDDLRIGAGTNCARLLGQEFEREGQYGMPAAVRRSLLSEVDINLLRWDWDTSHGSPKPLAAIPEDPAQANCSLVYSTMPTQAHLRTEDIVRATNGSPGSGDMQ